MDQKLVFFTILGMTAVTYLPRVLPVWLLSSRPLPPGVVAWLRHVPVAGLAAMLLPSLVVQEGQLALNADNLFLWAAFPTFLVAWKSDGIFAPVLVGMAIMAAARYFLGM